jgi:hypothetical protein
VCVSLFYVIDTGSIGSRTRHRSRDRLGVTYLPSAFSSDADYDLPLAFFCLIGSPSPKKQGILKYVIRSTSFLRKGIELSNTVFLITFGSF